MAIVQTPQYWIKNIAVIGMVAILAACGGGGGGNSSSDSGNGGGSGSVTPPPVELDVTPDNFVFEAKNDAMPGETYTSNTITVSGINAAVPVSITGGEYAIDNGDFTSAATIVSAGQTIVVRAMAAPTPDSIIDVVLTIGGVKGTYSIITPVDEAAPTAEFMFPPPVSMTDGATVLVRGVASDDYSKITAVTVNGKDVRPTGENFATWEVEVPLEPGNNKLVVETTDAAENTSPNAAEVMVHRGAIKEAFPDAENEFSGVVDLVIDRLDGRNRLITIGGETSEVISVDLSTGERSPFIIPHPFESGVNAIWGIALDEQTKEIFFRDTTEGGILAQPLDKGTSRFKFNKMLSGGWVCTVDNIDEEPKIVMAGGSDNMDIVVTNSDFSEFTRLSPATEGAENLLGESYGMTLDRVNGRYLVTDFSNQRIIAVDRTTGTQSIFSSNDVGIGDSFGDENDPIGGIAVDEENLRVIVAEVVSGKLFSIDLANGNRTLLSGPDIPNSDVILRETYGVKINTPASYAFVADHGLNGVVAVDLVTGHRVVFSKSKNY